MIFVHNRTSARNRDVSDKPRHYCRNLRCRSKLPEAVENHHHAFCCRGSFGSFYLNRCRVCGRDLRKQGRRSDAGRRYCRPPRDCRAEARKWPAKYEYGLRAGFSPTNARNAHSTGLKSGDRTDRPPFNCLRDWWWSGPVDGDLAPYAKDGLTVARLALEGDGCDRLRAPLTWPRMAWSDLDEAKRCAESLALCNLPLDPPRAARIKQDNSAPHPMGGPLNRPWPVDDGGSVSLGA